MPDGIPYGPAPAFVAAGAQLAVLEGNPGCYQRGLHRALEDAGRIPHRASLASTTRKRHVISGTFKVGMGDRFDESKMGAFPAGSLPYLDPDMHHYAMASGEVVVQVHGSSPLQFNYVNPNDDPSRKK